MKIRGMRKYRRGTENGGKEYVKRGRKRNGKIMVRRRKK